jgi:hypothetical protein
MGYLTETAEAGNEAIEKVHNKYFKKAWDSWKIAGVRCGKIG